MKKIEAKPRFQSSGAAFGIAALFAVSCAAQLIDGLVDGQLTVARWIGVVSMGLAMLAWTTLGILRLRATRPTAKQDRAA
ncbi:hypothetical protein ACIBSR_24655 [Streptomyces sp. NPDC049936]|uniref:hypothetical protein n=1 Tax=Streptomyces sp. NPDC049936 TaxID=3365599 RepID=UPI0037BE16B2